MTICDPYRVEPIWPGRTAVVIGGGPSLTPKQLHVIALARGDDRCRVVAINDAVFVANYADWLHAGDYKWWRWHIQRVERLGFKGIRTTCSEDVPAPWVNGFLEYSGNDGFDPDSSKCRSGGNSTYQGICISVHAGASRIICVGLDMKVGPDGERHWFGEHPEKGTTRYSESMAPKFSGLLPTLAERKIQIFNASPGTALEAFPLLSLEKALVNR